MSRRHFLRAASTAVALASPLVPRIAGAQRGVKLASAVLGDYSLTGPLIVAQERGFFKEEGLNAEYLPFRSEPDLAKAVVAGQVLLGVTGATDILLFREAGMPIKMIATHTEGNHFTLNVAPEIQTVAELKGKSIGVTRLGAAPWIFARMVAREEGWDPQRDVRIVALGGLDALLAALARKEIHAYVWGDGGAAMEQQGRSRVLMRLDAVTPKWISQAQYASEAGIRRQPDTIRKGMRAIFRALRLMRDRPEDVADVLGKRLGWSPHAVLRAHKISGGLFSHDGRISVEALASMQDTLLEQGVLEKRLPIEEHFTREFIPVRV